jgi:NADPH:quinone reductase
MRAVRVHQFGGPDALSYEVIPQPQPGPGEVRLKVEAAGINFIDIYYRTGQYPASLPLIPGSEAAGVVDAVGPDVTEFKPGDYAAFAISPGAYAEYVIVPAVKLVPVPDAVDARLAAAVMLQGMTAHYLAIDTYPLHEGEIALIHAAAGGLGLLLVQIAKLRGARVIGTVSTDEKALLAREAGADDVILYTGTDFEQEVKHLTDGRGVDVVYDSVGQTTFSKGLNCLRPRGMMVLCGQSSGAVSPLDPQVLNARGSLYLTRPTLGNYVAGRSELLQRASDLFEWMASGKLNVLIDRDFALQDAADAHRYLESRQSKGKLLLIPTAE